MGALALALVLASALIHTTWNVLVKRAEDQFLFTWLLLVASVILFTPIAVWSLWQGATVSEGGLVCIVGTTIAYGGYFTLLARSYRFGDVSISYPIARAVAPLATVFWGVLLLGERPSAAGIVGIALVVCAGVLLALPSGSFSWKLLPWKQGRQSAAGAAALSAVGTGLFSSAYSAIDKVGVSLVQPTLYIHLTFLGSVLVLWPVVQARYSRKTVLRTAREAFWPVVLAGAGCMGGYLLVLFALQQAPVSYVVPLRSTSILFTVLAGGWALREGELWRRLPLAAAIVAGVILIAWRG